MPHHAAFHQGLHCLLRQNQSLDIFLKIIAFDGVTPQYLQWTIRSELYKANWFTKGYALSWLFCQYFFDLNMFIPLLCLMHFRLLLSCTMYATCVDPEGGTGGQDPP